MLTLKVTERTEGGAKAPSLLRSGTIPGVVYGAHHASMAIAIPANIFGKILKEAGEATIVTLEGIGASIPTLIREVDLDPLTNQPRHVDFYAVTKGQKVEVAIPIVFSGTSPAVEAGANLVKVLHEIEVEADPMSLPHDVTVDISILATIGDQIRAKDIALPAGVTLITESEDVIVLVQEIAIEEEVAAPADISTIEVEKKGKEEEETETPAA
jgi:large subunit ribosomal protein L25